MYSTFLRSFEFVGAANRLAFLGKARGSLFLLVSGSEEAEQMTSILARKQTFNVTVAI